MSLKQAIAQFNQGEFYQCHDSLEALWMEAQDPQRRFYQGLLQVAVAYYHWNHGNCRGSAILLGEGLLKLRSFADCQEIWQDLVLDLDPMLHLDLDPLVAILSEHLAAIHAGQVLTGIPKILLRSRTPTSDSPAPNLPAPNLPALDSLGVFGTD